MFRQMNHLKKHFEQMWRIVQKNYPSSNQYESLYLAIVRKYFPFSESWKWNEYFPPKLPPFSSSFTWGFRGSGDGGKGGVSGPTNANPTFTSGRNCRELKTSWIHPDVGFSSGCDDNYVAIPGASATGGMSSKPISTATKAQIFRQWGWFRGQVCINL